MPRYGLAGLVALAIVALTVAIAGAHDARYESRVTIHNPSPPTFRGRVFSRLHRCEPQRLVKLMRPLPGRDEAVGQAMTDAEGRWHFAFVGTTRYYARVTRTVIERPGHRHVCGADRSRSI